MIQYFILLLPFSICYGYTMQMIMRKNKNLIQKICTLYVAILGTYFLCYNYEYDPGTSALAHVIVDVVSQWATPTLLPLTIAIMNGLQCRKMFDLTVILLFIPSLLLGIAGTVVHAFGLGEEAHQMVCFRAFNLVIAIEMVVAVSIIFSKMGGRHFAWHRLWSFFTKNSASRPLMVIGVSFTVFCFSIVDRLWIDAHVLYEDFYFRGCLHLIVVSFVLLLLCNALMQVNSPWITLKSLFEPTTIVELTDEEEDLAVAEEAKKAETTGTLPSELNTMSAHESDVLLDRIDQLAQSLRQYMEEEKAFLQTDITIDKVATHLGTNRFYISRLVNVERAMSFRDYINSLRIEHAKSYMKAHPEATQEHIAFVCGFSSASYFNRKFKQVTGQSPQDWREN